jgi:3-hydroxyisobutyrate dehydrogenase-like beta-hydroxyacid dehydrogenase
MSDDEAIGFVGLGAMGGRMASRLLAGGHDVVAYDTDPAALAALVERGARPTGSPAEVASHAPTVLLSLPTPDVVRAVALGPDGLLAGSAITTCIDLSTTGPAVSREVAVGLAAAGTTLIDGPVSGGVKGAERGTLTIMAACAPESLAAAQPLLEELAANVFHVGAQPGMGQLAKVLNNLLSATALAVTTEALALGVKEGLDAETLLAVLNASSGRNSATVQKFPEAVLPRTFDFGFALSLMSKDVHICLAEAQGSGVPMSVAEAVGEAWAQAEASAPAGADCTEIVRLVERAAHVTIGPREAGGA